MTELARLVCTFGLAAFSQTGNHLHGLIDHLRPKTRTESDRAARTESACHSHGMAAARHCPSSSFAS